MDERTRAAKVGSRSDLESVSLRGVTAAMPALAELDGPIELDISWETTPLVEEDGEHVRFTYRLEVTSGRADGLSVEAEFELLYSVTDVQTLEEEDLQAFADVSAAFSAHPYARELLQSLTVRSGLPPLVLGTIRSPVDPPLESGDADAPSVEEGSTPQ